ncbi:hypothetical protein ASC97_00855 [Rhizobium sp. Root1203]|uniref:hypothetical protein n=1 Tax=Rhizobium sp. Root1203 TaxID=1736427 RepID=UPI00070EEC32|nr:hypothetical protein [Rhizobium sp. Root1203]KQV32177.1 hypothetical protein ASC97_00855 [Rhizobium sp. Root1203]
MSALLSRYLKDFGEPAVAIPAVETDDFANDFGGFAEIPAETEVDVEAERQSAHAAGHAEATAALTEKYELEAQTVALVHQREIEELRDRYEVEAAELIATRLETIATEVAEIVSAATAKVLAPVMTDALAEKAALTLAGSLRSAILEGDAGTVIVKGPARLFDVLKNALGEKAALLRHHETPDVDLTVEFGDAILVTRMSAWATSLKKVLE